MNAIRFLPTIVVSHQPLHLPCAEETLVSLAIAIGDRRRLLPGLMKGSPSLLIFACHQFFQDHLRAPESGDELIAWFGGAGVELFRDLPAGWSRNDVKQSRHKRMRKFARSVRGFEFPTGNKRLRKSLARLFSSIPDQDPAAVKDWIHRIIGNEVKGKHFGPGEEEALKSNTNYRFTDEPNTESSVPRVESLIALACKSAESQSDFQFRLKQEKLLSLKQLAYGASHEINNPLANIATRAQSLMSDESNPERRRKLAVIYEQAMRAHEMISDLMLFAHPPNPTFVLADVYELIKTVATEMRLQLRSRGASIDIHRYPDVGRVWIDETQIGVAIKALVKNSLESFEGSSKNGAGRIIIRIWLDPDSHVRISITDNGPGVSPDAAGHLFDPFFSGREAGRGLGFGLSKAWRIMELHRGELEWDESFTEGTKFIFRIPTTQPAVARIDKADAA